MSKYRSAETFLSFMFLLLTIGPLGVFALDEETTIYISGSETITVGTWDLPPPLDKYHINFHAIPSFEGDNTVSWNVEKDSISPGESVSLAAGLGEGKYDCKMDLRFTVVDESTGDQIVDETADSDLGSVDVPGSWSSPQIPVATIPLEEFFIPAELTINLGFSLSSQYSLIISTYGLQPRTVTLEYSSSMTKNTGFSKPSGVGAEINLSSTRIRVTGSITVSVGLSLLGWPTPLEKEFASVPIGEWVTQHSQYINMATLKTPIAVEVSLNRTTVTLGEYVPVSGQVTPRASDITIQIFAAGTMVGITETDEDGSYSFNWQPTNTGTIAVYTKSPETKYTTSTSSSAVNLTIREPSEPSITIGPLELSIIFLVLGVVAVLIAFFRVRKQRARALAHRRGTNIAAGSNVSIRNQGEASTAGSIRIDLEVSTLLQFE